MAWHGIWCDTCAGKATPGDTGASDLLPPRSLQLINGLGIGIGIHGPRMLSQLTKLNFFFKNTAI